MIKKNLIYKILSEPLLHFLLIGAGLFLLYSTINETIVEDDEAHVVISQSDVEKITTEWVKSRGVAPSEDEVDSEIEQLIKEKVLYREAMKKSLDKDDDTIRTHLASKMEFVLNDLTPVKEPSDDELHTFLSKHSEMFKESAFVSFNQVLFTADKDTKDIHSDAENFLQRLQESKNSKVSTVGDLIELSERGLNNLISEDFTQKLFNTPVGSWQGPLVSKHGVHLVHIHSLTPEHTPELSKIRDLVTVEWRKQQQDKANAALYKKLLQKYTIEIKKTGSK